MQYTYTAKLASGETASGVLTAESLHHAQQQLREKGLFPLSLGPLAGRSLAELSGWSRKARVPKRDLLAFTSQWAIMARAGIDLAGALGAIARQTKNAVMKRTIEQVHAAVAAGERVSVALAAHGSIFGEAYVASVAAGEASGQLPEVLTRLSQLLRSEIRLRATLRGLLAYPLLLAGTSFLVILALIFFVLPQFAEVFGQLEVPLPVLTQWLLGFSDELRVRAWLWLTVIVGATIAVIAGAKSSSGRRWRHRASLHVVGLRDITQALLIGRTFRLLGSMIESGVPLLDGLRLARASVRNVFYRELFDTLKEEVLNGRSMGAALAASSFVPPAASQMVLTAERTGTLGAVLQAMAEFYEEEAENRLREAATLVEPLIIIVMGVVVAFVVLSLMLPLFDFATLANQAN